MRQAVRSRTVVRIDPNSSQPSSDMPTPISLAVQVPAEMPFGSPPSNRSVSQYNAERNVAGRLPQDPIHAAVSGVRISQAPRRSGGIAMRRIGSSRIGRRSVSGTRSWHVRWRATTTRKQPEPVKVAAPGNPTTAACASSPITARRSITSAVRRTVSTRSTLARHRSSRSAAEEPVLARNSVTDHCMDTMCRAVFSATGRSTFRTLRTRSRTSGAKMMYSVTSRLADMTASASQNVYGATGPTAASVTTMTSGTTGGQNLARGNRTPAIRSALRRP